MAKVTFLQPTKLSDLDFDSRPTGRSTATYADVHSENPVAAVSLIGDGFLITANPISWKGDIRAAMIDSPDPDRFGNILIENVSTQPSDFVFPLLSLDLSTVTSMLMSGPDKVLGSKHADMVFGLGGGDVIQTGAGGDTLEGGAGDDRLIGGRGKDTLLGGEGGDEINGGPGKDNFVFADPGKADRVLDFSRGEDSLLLDNAAWSGLGGEGGLKASAFKLGGKATDADNRILYNAATGVLKHDANGDESGGITTIARLDPNLKLGHQDFEII